MSPGLVVELEFQRIQHHDGQCVSIKNRSIGGQGYGKLLLAVSGPWEGGLCTEAAKKWPEAIHHLFLLCSPFFRQANRLLLCAFSQVTLAAGECCLHCGKGGLGMGFGRWRYFTRVGRVCLAHSCCPSTMFGT